MASPLVVHRDSVTPQGPSCPTKATLETPDTVRTLKRKPEAVEELQESLESVSARVQGSIITPPSRTSQEKRSTGYEDDIEEKRKKQRKYSETTPSASSNSLEFEPGLMRTPINTFTPTNAGHAARQPLRGSDMIATTQDAAMENEKPNKQPTKSAKPAKQPPPQTPPTAEPSWAPTAVPPNSYPSPSPVLPKSAHHPAPPNPSPTNPRAAATGAPTPAKRQRVAARPLTAGETAAMLRAPRAALEAMKRPEVETLARRLGVYWPGATKAGHIDRVVRWQVSCAEDAGADVRADGA